MDLDLKDSSVKRIMDNPGLAFLTQLVDKSILAKIYGDKSDFYEKSINYNVLTSHKLLSMAVYNERDEGKRESIQRKFFLPKNIPLKYLYFYFYINFRDKLIPLLATACKANWDNFEYSEKLYFSNKVNVHSKINMFINEHKGNQFLNYFNNLLNLINFKREDDEVKFDKINEVSRSQLFYEFVLLMGDQDTYALLEELKDPDSGLFKTLPDDYIDHQISEMKFAKKTERLFNLLSLDSIDGSEFVHLDDSTDDSYSIFENKIIAMMFNSSYINEKALKLKKCVKISLRIRRDNNLSLSDCLSTPYSFLNL